MAESLGELYLELGLDPSKLDRQMIDVERRLQTYGRKLERSISTITIDVDDSQVASVGTLVDKISDRVSRAQKKFQQSPIRPIVDDIELLELSENLDELSARLGDIQADFKRTALKVEVDDGDLMEVSESLDEIGSRLDDARADFKGSPIVVEVDDDQVASLENRLDGLSDRLSRTQRAFQQSSIKPVVDDIELLELSENLDELSARLGDIQADFRRSPMRVKVDDGDLLELSETLDEIGSRLDDARSDFKGSAIVIEIDSSQLRAAGSLVDKLSDRHIRVQRSFEQNPLRPIVDDIELLELSENLDELSARLGDIQSDFRRTGMKVEIDDGDLLEVSETLDEMGSRLDDARSDFKGASIVVAVDDSRLTDLNNHLAQKFPHLQQVQGEFSANPLTPSIDDAAFNTLNRRIEEMRQGMEEARADFVKFGQVAELNPVQIKVDRRELDSAIADAQVLEQLSGGNGAGQSRTSRGATQESAAAGQAKAIADSIKTMGDRLAVGLQRLEKVTSQSAKQRAKDNGFLSSVRFGVGQEFGAVIAKSLQKSAKSNFGFSLSKSSRKSLDLAAKPLKFLIKENPEFQDYTERVSDRLGKKVREAGYTIGDGIVAGLDAKGDIRTKINAFASEMPEVSNLGQEVDRLKPKMAEAGKEFRDALFSETALKKVFEGIGDRVSGYREEALKERAAPLVRERAAEILRQKRAKNSAKVVTDETEELFIVTGGYAQARGLSGARIAKDLNSQFDGQKKQAIWTKNQETDINKISGQDYQDFARQVARSLARPNLRGYSNDAVEMAAQGLAAVDRNPDITLKILGESGGGFAAEEAYAILKEMGVKNLQYMGLGTPDFAARLDKSGRNKILSTDEILGQEIDSAYKRRGLSSRSSAQSILGAEDHPYEGYKSPRIAELVNFIEGAPTPFSGKDIQETGKAASAFESIDLGGLDQKQLEDLAKQAFQNLQTVRRRVLVATDETKEDLQSLAGRFEAIYLRTASEPESFAKARGAIARLEEVFEQLRKTPGVESGIVALQAAKEAEQYLSEFRASGKGKRYGGTTQAKFNDISSQLEQSAANFRDPLLGVKQPRPKPDMAPLELMRRTEESLVPVESGPPTVSDRLKRGAAELGNKAADSAEAALIARINEMLATIPGQRDVIDADPRKISKLSDLKIQDYIHMARLGGEDVAGVLNQVYGAAQGAENVALDFIPGGRAIKGIGKNVALPAAAFGAAGALPGGAAATEAITAAINAAAGVPAGLLADAVSGTVGSAILEAVGAVPLLGPRVGPALADAVAGLIEGGIITGAGALAAGAAPVIGGQAMLGTGKQALRAIAPGGDNRKKEAAQLAAATQKQLKALQSATANAAKLMPVDPRRGRWLAGAVDRRLPALRGKVNEAIAALPASDRMATREGTQLANQKSQISRVESKLDELIDGIKRLAEDPRGEMNRAVLGEDIIDADIINDVLAGTEALRALAPAAEQPAPSIKDLKRQIKELGRAFSAQAKAIKFMAESDTDSTKSVAASRDLVDSSGLAKESIEKLVSNAGDRATPGLRKVAGIAKGQITKANKKVADFTQPGMEIGGDIGDGLSKGIIKKIAQVEKSAEVMAKSVIASAEDEFEIRSPSRVFQKIGEYLVLGLEKGMSSISNLEKYFDDFIDGTAKRFPQFSNQIKGLGAAIKGLTAGFIGLKVIETVFPVLKDFASNSLNTAVQLERVEAQLGFVLGTAAEAKAEIGTLFDEARVLGTNVFEDIGGKTKLEAAAKGTSLQGVASDQLFEAGRQAGQVFQLDAERQEAVYRALEQQISKGKISAEELRQQMGEHLPGAFQIAARAMNVTTSELDKMLQNGELLSEDFLPKFAQQLSAETSSGLVGATKTAQASINRMDTAVIGLQKTVGDGLLPAQKLGLETAAAGIEALTNHIDDVMSLALSFGLLMGGNVALGMMKAMAGTISLSAVLKSLPGLIKTTAIAAKSLDKAFGPMLLKLFAIQVAIEGAMVAYELLNGTTSEFGESVDSATGNIDRLIKKLDGVTDSATNASKSLGRIREGATTKFFGLDEKTTQDEATKMPGAGFASALREKIGFKPKEETPFEDRNVISKLFSYDLSAPFKNAAVDTLFKKQQKDTVKDAEEMAKSTASLIKTAYSYLEGENRAAVDSLVDLDKKLESVRLKQSAVRSMRPGSVEEIEMYQEQIDSLLSQRGVAVQNVGELRGGIDQAIASIESQIKFLESDRKAGFIEEEVYSKALKTAEDRLKSLKKIQVEFNKELNSTALNLEQLARALENISDRLSDYNTAISNTQGLKLISLDQRRGLPGVSPGQIEGQTQAINDAALQAQAKVNQQAIAALKSQLASPEYAQGISAVSNVANISQAGPAELRRVAERNEETRQIAEAAEALAQLKELESEAIALNGQISSGAADVREQLKDTSREVEDFYRQMARQLEDVTTAAEVAQNELGMAEASADIKRAVMDVSGGFADAFASSLIDMVEAFNKPIQNALQAQQQMIEAERQLLDTQLQATQMQNGLLSASAVGGFGVGGFGGIGGASAGPGALVGIVGNSGVGSGSHLDVRYNREYAKNAGLMNGRVRAEVPAEIYNRLLADGVPLGQTPLTSGYGPRNLDIPGASKFHEGIDFGLATGTKITSAVPIQSVSDPWRNDAGGGWVTTVTFADGVALELLHQDPSVQSAALGSGGAPLAAPAQIGSSGANNNVTIPSGLTGEGQRIAQYADNPNVMAALDMIAMAEMGPDLLADRGGFYTGFGGRSISSLRQHPYNGSQLTPQGSSSASGRYQFMGDVWEEVQEQLGLPDFSPGSQTLAAIKKLDYRGILDEVAAGNIEAAWSGLGQEWAAFEGNPYGQGTTLGMRQNAIPYFNQQRQMYAGGGSSARSPVSAAPARDTKYGYERQEVAQYVSQTESFGQFINTLAPAAKRAYEAMDAAANAEGIDLQLISGFRSLQEQEDLWTAQIARRGSPEAAAEFSAPPGYSLHHTGRSVDIGSTSRPDTNLERSFENTEEFRWLKANASSFGFEMPYDRGNTNGAGYEPWEFQYTAGQDTAGTGLGGSPLESGIVDAINQGNAANTARIGEAMGAATQTLEASKQSIMANLQANNLMAEVEFELAQRQAQRETEQSRLDREEVARGYNRTREDLEIDQMPEGINKDLTIQQVDLERSREDAMAEISRFIVTLMDDLAATEDLFAVNEQLGQLGKLPADVAAENGKLLQSSLTSGRQVLADLTEYRSDIAFAYTLQIRQMEDERQRLESARMFQVRSQVEGVQADMARAQIPQLNRRGMGQEAIDLEFGVQQMELDLEFDGLIKNLEELERSGDRTSTEVEEMIALYGDLKEVRFTELIQEQQRLSEELERSAAAAVTESEDLVYGAISERADMYGLSMPRGLEEERAIASQERDFEERIRQLEDSIPDAEKLEEAKQNLESWNEIRLDNISTQFNDLDTVLGELSQTGRSMFADWLTGSKTAGEAVMGVLQSLGNRLAQMASDGLFNALFGGGDSNLQPRGDSKGIFGGAGLFGQVLTEVFKFNSGIDAVPSADFTSYRKGLGPISEALVQEGPNSVLAALTPGERVLNLYEAKEYPMLKAQAARAKAMQIPDTVYNFRSGGVVGGSVTTVGTTVNVGDVNVGSLPTDVDPTQVAQDIEEGLPKMIDAAIARQRQVRGLLS